MHDPLEVGQSLDIQLESERFGYLSVETGHVWKLMREA